jgi:hypothetical protein
VLGPSIAAAGRQWSWCAAQSLCLVVSLALDPMLIPWAQRTFGNGSLGVSLSIGIAEIAMLAFGLRILPRGVLDRGLSRTLGRSVAAALAAAAAGIALRGVPVVAVPVVTLVYFGVLHWFRELDSELLMLAPPWLSRPLHSWLGLTR